MGKLDTARNPRDIPLVAGVLKALGVDSESASAAAKAAARATLE